MDANLFKYYVANAGKTLNDVANQLGINPATLTRKINGESDFFRNEILIVANYLELDSDALRRVFFSD